MHFTTPTIILALLSAKALVLGSVIPDNSQTFILSGYCWNNSLTRHEHYPTEDDHNAGAISVCNMFLGGQKSKQINMYDQNLGHSDLTAYDKKAITWVYEMTLRDTTIKQDVDFDTCVDGFGRVLSEGKLGDAYCVVHGQETVLSKGGRWEKPMKYGTLRFDVRKKRGT
ncbi:hypothetical protein BDV96DRAFT_644583 [Lophiotrema nucula]|uniref:Ecp2 effector protein domain-containing protein n=1 Tax=Lophiotrema nucula TaxID=690887 RepID=A0A6A5ZFE3_9PLEO|nr:hypothetical protein BDV96DRAFT_644583 [Lophiotrema nucula]